MDAGYKAMVRLWNTVDLGTAVSWVISATNLGSLSSREAPTYLPQRALFVGNPKHRTFHNMPLGTALFFDPFRKLKNTYQCWLPGLVKEANHFVL